MTNFEKHKMLMLNKNWLISYDNFFYLLEGDNFIKQRNFLGEDLLQIESLDNSYLIDVGWYPDFDPNGRFIVRLIQNLDWDTPVEKIGSNTPKNVIEIIQTIITNVEINSQ